jgi:3'-phosphoadenosine 5'-phosphosulfate sulfotransferase
VLAEVTRLRVAIQQSLNSPRTRQRITVEFRQDVFTFLFMGRGRKDGLWLLLEKDDFRGLFFLVTGTIYSTNMVKALKYISL